MERAERVCGLRKERTNMATEQIIASITRWYFRGEIQNDWCHISEKLLWQLNFSVWAVISLQFTFLSERWYSRTILLYINVTSKEISVTLRCTLDEVNSYSNITILI
jgi:hypothetical protein